MSIDKMSKWLSRILAVGAVVFVLPNHSFADAIALINPANEFGEVGFEVGSSGNLDFNPDFNPVISNEGFSHTNRIEIDQSTGTIKGYSSYSLDSARTITNTENIVSVIDGTTQPALVTNLYGGFMYGGTVSAPEESGPSYATVSIDIEGSFNYEYGTPSLALGGNVSIGLAPGGDFASYVNFGVDGGFSNVDYLTLMPVNGSVLKEQGIQVYDANGNVVDVTDCTEGCLSSAMFPEFVPTVEYLGEGQEALGVRVSLSVPIQDGDYLDIGGGAWAGATHAFLENFSELEYGETGEVDAASGYVDFLNTAIFGIELPEGFTLEGADAPPSSIISTASSSPVPVPSAVWLFGSGLIGLIGVKRRAKGA